MDIFGDTFSHPRGSTEGVLLQAGDCEALEAGSLSFPIAAPGLQHWAESQDSMASGATGFILALALPSSDPGKSLNLSVPRCLYL